MKHTSNKPNCKPSLIIIATCIIMISMSRPESDEFFAEDSEPMSYVIKDSHQSFGETYDFIQSALKRGKNKDQCKTESLNTLKLIRKTVDSSQLLINSLVKNDKCNHLGKIGLIKAKDEERNAKRDNQEKGVKVNHIKRKIKEAEKDFMLSKINLKIKMGLVTEAKSVSKKMKTSCLCDIKRSYNKSWKDLSLGSTLRDADWIRSSKILCLLKNKSKNCVITKAPVISKPKCEACKEKCKPIKIPSKNKLCKIKGLTGESNWRNFLSHHLFSTDKESLCAEKYPGGYWFNGPISYCRKITNKQYLLREKKKNKWETNYGGHCVIRIKGNENCP